MAKTPDFNVMLRGEKFSDSPPRYRYHKIGVAWTEENGLTLKIDFPTTFTLGPQSTIRLFTNDMEKKDAADKDF